MIVRPPTLRPVKQAVALFDRQAVDARDPLLHQAIRGKFPIIVAIAAEPPAIGVMPFIGETNGDRISTWISDQVSFASNVISVLSILDTGQFFSASLAMRANASSSRFGTCARKVSADRLMRNPASSCSSVTAASVLSSVGV